MKKLWRDPVWSAVIAAAIIAAGSYFTGFWPVGWRLLATIPALLATPVAFPVWLIGLAVVALVGLVPVVKLVRAARKPQFLSYTSDSVFDIAWSWRWLPPGFYSSHYQIADLTPRCPSCRAVLTVNDYRRPLVCCVNETCQWQWERERQHGSRIGHSTELESLVRNEIDRRIHAGERG